MIPRYRIGSETMPSGDPQFLAAAEAAHRRNERPLCLCQPAGVAVYLARRADRFVVRRLPHSGALHRPDCESYAPPADLSGLAHVLGRAISEDIGEGITELDLGFPLSRKGSVPAPPRGEEPDTMLSDGSQLSLLGLLHHLWEQAGLLRWTPAVDGKRNWQGILKALLSAAEGQRLRGRDLGPVLFIPEPFRTDHQAVAAARRRAHLASIAGSSTAGQQLHILIGEIKEIGRSRFGYRMTLRHVPEVSFQLDEDLHRRLQKRFECQLALRDGTEGIRLMAIATFAVSEAGAPSIVDMAVMTVNSRWIPVETLFEKLLVDQLVGEKRHFLRSLRYELPNAHPVPAAILADTAGCPTVLYIVPPGTEDEFVAATQGLIARSGMQPWLWNASQLLPPPLPVARPFPARP